MYSVGVNLDGRELLCQNTTVGSVSSMCILRNGQILLADSANGRIWAVDPDSGNLSVFAGGEDPFAGPNGPAEEVALSDCRAVASYGNAAIAALGKSEFIGSGRLCMILPLDAYTRYLDTWRRSAVAFDLVGTDHVKLRDDMQFSKRMDIVDRLRELAKVGLYWEWQLAKRAVAVQGRQVGQRFTSNGTLGTPSATTIRGFLGHIHAMLDSLYPLAQYVRTPDGMPLPLPPFPIDFFASPGVIRSDDDMARLEALLEGFWPRLRDTIGPALRALPLDAQKTSIVEEFFSVQRTTDNDNHKSAGEFLIRTSAMDTELLRRTCCVTEFALPSTNHSKQFYTAPTAAELSFKEIDSTRRKHLEMFGAGGQTRKEQRQKLAEERRAQTDLPEYDALLEHEERVDAAFRRLTDLIPRERFKTPRDGGWFLERCDQAEC